MSRRTRNFYNALLYGFLRTIFFWSSRIEFFPGTNGDSLTFRYGEYVYKCWNLPFLFRRDRPFAHFKKMHEILRERDLAQYLPPFTVGRWYVAYQYIPHTRDLIHVLLEESSATKRIQLLAHTLSVIGKFYEKGILHGDLKPKNILIGSDERAYVIDLEDAVLAQDSDFIEDYRKFIPRILYLFNAEELRNALTESSAPQVLSAYVEKFLAPFNVRGLIQGIEDLQFEQHEDTPGEDIDIRVPSAHTISVIIERLRAAALDYRLFFRSRNDVKVYIYNLSGLVELDVHLTLPIGRLALMWEKTRRHAPVQIAVTGPDGVGKTTLLSRVQEHPHHALIAHMSKRIIHAWRFAREGWTPPAGVWSLKERLAARWRESLLGRRIAYERFLRRNTDPLILLDRSFYDPYLQGSRFKFALWPCCRLLFPPNIRTIVLKASPSTIIARKGELSMSAIEQYYRRVAQRLPTAIAMDTERNTVESQEHLERIISFFTLTQKYFLP